MRRIAWLVLISVLTGLAGGAIAAWQYWQIVVVHPGPELERRHILGVIAEESPVYFRDGVTRLGVFFDDEHREFVDFDALPRAYVAGIVAAEDNRFWVHPGFDMWGFARAMRDNLLAMDVVAGGSTLTQQTAKNIYYRPDRSLKSKLEEALRALQLERKYTKAEILTFYVNQFHVAGNGRGLGIAARHFFDKDVSALTTVESAFLAGLVKAPSYYDPFTGDEAHRKQAIERAHARTVYVLRRIGEESPGQLAGPMPDLRDPASVAAFQARTGEVQRIQQEARSALDAGFELPFKRGVFRFDSSAVLDEVSRRLSEPPFAEVLSAAGIDDPARAGLQVITTLDRDAQASALYGLWHHLTEVGVMMESKGILDFIRTDARPPQLDPGERVVPMEFRLARVVGVARAADKVELDVDLGGRTCRVDRAGLVRIGAAVARARQRSSTSKVSGTEVDSLASALPKDAVVWISVREAEPALLCDLELRPELQGAVLVAEDGEVRAMVGGNDNRNFNRATALRQMGSTWKMLVLQAALELGWSPTDVLDNRRNVFPFSTTFYYPRADHTPAPETTLAWAGVTSENLATVWLLFHLTDRLDQAQIGDLARAVDMARRSSEPADAYALRMQKAGVLALPSRAEEARFLRSRREVLAGGVRGADRTRLQSLTYGWGYEAERQTTSDSARLAALENSWLWMWERRQSCGEQYRVLADGVGEIGMPPASSMPGLSFHLQDNSLEVACGHAPEGYLPASDPGWAALSLGPFSPVRPVPEADMVVADRLSVATIDALRSSMERLRLESELGADGAPDPYAPELLYDNQDFRVLLAMKYVRKLAQRYGVQSPVQIGLSMALGASDITLEEMTRVYEGMFTGNRWTFPGVASGPGGAVDVGPPLASSLLIKEIRDVDGHVIYRARPKAEPGTSPEVAAMTGDILRNVVEWGTGKRSKAAISVGGHALPIGGKTGTTNDFKNAAFLGYAPELDGTTVAARSGWAVGVYVGYDDNRPMVNGGIKLAGASGALPAWTYTVRGLAAAGLLGGGKAPSGGWKLVDPPECVRMTVSESHGRPAEGGAASVLTRKLPEVAVAAAPPIGDRPDRPDRPVRIAPSTVDAEAIIRRRQNGADGGLWGPLLRGKEPSRPAEGAPRAPPPKAPQPQDARPAEPPRSGSPPPQAPPSGGRGATERPP